MHRYVGVTIGPIVDTIMDASSPAALWFASSLFSDVARRICSEVKNVFTDAVIYSPYFGTDIQIDDGIGKFHDRIIFATDQCDSEKMKWLITKVKRETAVCFPEKFVNPNAIAFLEKYIQIHYVILEEMEVIKSNGILALSPYLDVLELMRSFPEDDKDNVFRKLFQGEEESGNLYIKKSSLFQKIKEDSNQLKKDKNGLWTVADIACDHGEMKEKLKRKNYYAVVQADGDNMGKFLENLNNKMVTEFSKACLEYDKHACERIGKFGGMTIYAGGDDLLFLAPVLNSKGESVFDLCAEIGKQFHEHITNAESFKNNSCIPTVSFGIALQHKKYPLYEALSRGRELLGLAKENRKQKNSIAIEVLKHSGKSIKVIVPNEEHEVYQEILSLGDEEEKTVHSVIYTLQKFQKLISILNLKMKKKEIDEDAYRYAFMNLFDNVEQIPSVDYLKRVCDTYRKYFVIGDTKICVPKEEDADIPKKNDESLKAYLNLLLIKKFLLEKDEENETVS